MTKTNYAKVEEILDGGLRRMQINQLFEETEKEAERKDAALLGKAHSRLISALKRDLKRLRYKDHHELYANLGIKKSELKKKIENPSALSREDWEAINKIKQKIDLYKAELTTQLPEVALNQMVEDERVRHINKRFNVNKKWLPLH